MVQVGDDPRDGHLALPRPAEQPRDRAEFVRQLYAEHGAPLLSYVLRLTVGDRYRAEDIVQETLLRAWHNAEALTPERGSVRGWLMRVAHNVTVDGYRAKRARPTEVNQDDAAETAVWDRSEEVLTALEVKRALSRLTPEHRAVLIEVYFKDRTAVEAARVLGIPVGTVKSRIHYALRTLRLAFDEGRELAV
ncbi:MULTISPECIES: sigma-70 family RNA polymerase sigma factor [unclassified Frankia]|uniref:sigma-70 family RNA polymerase sigma factor n=1 Tax=unclassified Frankia TaxID=2632575 RepID=UPI001EF507A1|nr:MULTISPECIES: sigma-70 family RNA polymerase sigma factor [unclassified Frankia]